MKDKKVAALLSLLFPGVGHLYIGKYADAGIFIAGAGILWSALYLRGYYLMINADPRYYLVLGALIFIYLFSIFDAYRKAK
ncbi:MAG: hypothetical protein AAB506_01880 [Patescibacteria group bacterium]